MAFSEWVKLKKKKDRKDEQRSSETHGKSGDLDQQGEVAGGDSEVSAQRVFVFAVPEL